MKPPPMPTQSKQKTQFAPPVATFQTKTYEYNEPKKINKGPDILM